MTDVNKLQLSSSKSSSSKCNSGSMDIDKRIETASKLPRTQVEASLPPSLLRAFKQVSKSLSIPWEGVLVGLTQPIQYAMNYSTIDLEKSDWWEPTIFWPLLHMPSGTRKSGIHKFVKDVIKSLESNKTEYHLCESTFEKMGLLMAKNDGKMIWQFDEARHFFAQLGLYKKEPSRDEGALLFLYDGSEWNHSSAKGVQFDNPYTKLSLGGLTQTAHIVNMFTQNEQMTSGLIPRFFVMGLEPVRTSIREITSGSNEVKSTIIEKILSVKQLHNSQVVTYKLLRSSKAFELYAQYHERVEEWIGKYEYHLRFQHAITMMSKSKGQTLRLAAILNAFFQAWNPEEVKDFEKSSPFLGDDELPVLCISEEVPSSTDPNEVTLTDEAQSDTEGEGGTYKTNEENNNNCEKVQITMLPVSVMAMQAAVSLVTLALSQNLMIQGIEIARFNTTLPYDTAGFFEEVEVPIINSSSQTASNAGKGGKKRKRTTDDYTDVGLVMTAGGMHLDGSYLNHYKKLGGKTNKQRITDAFVSLEKAAFGLRHGTFGFQFRDDIVQFLTQSAEARSYLIDQGISIQLFLEALSTSSSSAKPTVESSGPSFIPSFASDSSNPLPSVQQQLPLPTSPSVYLNTHLL